MPKLSSGKNVWDIDLFPILVKAVNSWTTEKEKKK
jgi:hypothetical protein